MGRRNSIAYSVDIQECGMSLCKSGEQKKNLEKEKNTWLHFASQLKSESLIALQAKTKYKAPCHNVRQQVLNVAFRRQHSVVLLYGLLF